MELLPGAEERQAHCEEKRANAMTEIPTGGVPVSTAGEPEPCGCRAPTAVRAFQKRPYVSYKDSIPLPLPYQYIHGNPVQPVVPLDTALHGVFIIGAYPSARFAAIGGEGV
jgi:hypothetical protein